MNFEEAKKLLYNSGKSGKIVCKSGDNWDVEFINIETSYISENKSEKSKENDSGGKKNLSFELLSFQRTQLSKEIYKLKLEIKGLKRKQLNHVFDDFNSSEITIKKNEKKIMYLEEEISNLDLDLEEKERILQREPPKVSVGRFDYTGSLEEEKKIKNNRKMNYEEAKKLLSESGKSGKILRKDDDSWDVEFNNIENLNKRDNKVKKSEELASNTEEKLSFESAKEKKIEIHEIAKKEKITFESDQIQNNNDVSWLKKNNEFVRKSGNIYAGLQIYHPTTSEMFDELSGRILDFKDGQSYALGFYAFLLSEIIPKNSQLLLTSVPGSSPLKDGSLNRIIKKLSGGPIIDGSMFLKTKSQREKKSHGFRPTNDELSQTIELNNIEFPRGGKILLLDDVTTTGQSFDVCKKIIRDSGYPHQITCLALSVTDRYSKQRGIALNIQLKETWDIKPINNFTETSGIKLNQQKKERKVTSKPFNRAEAEKAAKEYHRQKGQFLEIAEDEDLKDKIKDEIKKGIKKVSNEYQKQKTQFLEIVDEKDIKNKIKGEIKKGIKKAANKFINFFK
jgi:hypoxanthine phosphoribosyltransferase